ncbi:NAD(P)-dependent oxidoreductase [Streptomyces sp. NPDC006259]|uniref:NAD(P)-dependent oxidoreductase n=1 Tax=Streptomyces sp. NPDC006259 TaxID=3364740 RepID=UPI00367D6DAB
MRPPEPLPVLRDRALGMRFGPAEIGRRPRTAAPLGDPVPVHEPRAPRRVPATAAGAPPTADVLSQHTPVPPACGRMVPAAELAVPPRVAVLVDTARGTPVDTVALGTACAAGPRAIPDVTEPEPMTTADSPSGTLPNAAPTPHVAGSPGSQASRPNAMALPEPERHAAGLPALSPVARRHLAVPA